MKPFVTNACGRSVLHSGGLIADDRFLRCHHICEFIAACRSRMIVHDDSKNVLQIYIQFSPIGAISAEDTKKVRLLEKRVSAGGILRKSVRCLSTKSVVADISRRICADNSNSMIGDADLLSSWRSIFHRQV